MEISQRITVLLRTALLLICADSVAWAQIPSWTQLSATGGPTNGIQSVVYDSVSNRAILFGGVIGTPCCTSFNDVWVLTNADGVGGTPIWNHLSPAAPNGSPLPRSFHSALYDSASNRMIIFAGGQASPIGYFDPLFNDVWVLTNANGLGGTSTWIPLSPSGTPPVPREGHGAIYDAANNRMIVFGGGNNGIMDVPNDLWALTNANGLGGTSAWIQLNPSGPLPAPNERFAVGYDAASNHMMMFGGCCYWNNNTWLLTNANGLAGTPAWTQITPSGTQPPIREVHAYGYDPSLNELIIFGYGSAAGTYNDTWLLLSANDVTGAPAWDNVIPNNVAGSPPLPFNGGDFAAYDPAGARLMLMKSEVDSQGGTFINPWVLEMRASGTSLGMDVSKAAGDVADSVWADALAGGVQFVIVNAWGGGARGICTKDQLVGDGGVADACTAYPTNTKGAQGNGLATGAYAVLNYFFRSDQDNSGTYQISQALDAAGEGLANLKLIAVDVEQCCGEFVGWTASRPYGLGSEIEDPNTHIQEVITAGTSGRTMPTWNDSGGTTNDGSVVWRDTGFTVINQTQRLDRICEAIAAIPSNVKPVIYTYKAIWNVIAGGGNCPASFGVDLSKVYLWDVEHGVVFNGADGNEYCGDGLVGLSVFNGYGPWTFRSGDQYAWSNAVKNEKGVWQCPSNPPPMFFGVSADLDLFSTSLFQ